MGPGPLVVRELGAWNVSDCVEDSRRFRGLGGAFRRSVAQNASLLTLGHPVKYSVLVRDLVLSYRGVGTLGTDRNSGAYGGICSRSAMCSAVPVENYS